MAFKMIKSEEDYLTAVRRIDTLMYHVIPGTKEGEELEHLTKLVEQYETHNYPFLSQSKGLAPDFDTYDVQKRQPNSKFVDKKKS